MNALSHKKPAWYLVGLLLLGACGHDAKRTNPLDPELTPPVALELALNDTAGAATLTWTPYDGEAPFAEYRVLRNIADRTTVDTLAVMTQIDSTTFVHPTVVPDVTYAYRIMVQGLRGR